jgi:hypothetical protein
MIWLMIGTSFLTAGIIIGIQTLIQIRNDRGGEKRGK